MSTIDELRLRADGGDAEAQVELGRCFARGSNGATQDVDESFKWFRKAAEQGNGLGEYNLGVCYASGRGVTRDVREGAKWYLKAAEQGNEDALHHIKNLIWFRNNTELLSFITQQAQQGNHKVQLLLAEYYQDGNGFDKDLEEAADWYRLAAEQGNAEGQFKLGECYQQGDGVDEDLEQVAKWYRLAAEQGHAMAQLNLGECYEHGWGVDRNLHEAAKWYHKAAEQGNTVALNSMKSLAQSGSKEAFSFMAQLAQQGDEKMQIFAAECCKNGWGVDKNLAEAARWYQLAAEQGNKGALEIIFYLAKKGAKEALSALLALALQNNIEAQNMVAWCHEKGKGVTRDITEAIKWYRKAADQGDKKASANVQHCVEYGNRDSFSCISPSTAAELSFKETSPLLPIESFDSSVTNPSGVLLSPDDNLIVIFRNEEPAMTVMLDAFTWKEKWRKENISPQAFSPDGNFLLVCQKDSPTAAILDANTGAIVRELSGQTGTVNAAAWSSSNLIATGSNDKTIRISRPDGTLVRVLTGHKAAVDYLAFGSDGNQLFSHSPHHNGLHLWDVAAGAIRSCVGNEMDSCKISPDGFLIAGVRNCGLQFFQWNHGKYVKLSTFFRETIPITWSPDSKHLFAKKGQTLYIVHFTKELPFYTSFHDSTDIAAMAFSSDGDRAVTIDNDGRVEYHLCLLEKASPRARVKIAASRIPLGAMPLFVPKPSHSVQEALDRIRVLIERTLLPTSFQNLQRAMQRINDSSVSDIHARVCTENAIEDNFAQISEFIESESHPGSSPESLKQSIAAIESVMQSLLSDSSSISLPTSLSSFSSSESNALLAEDRIAHGVPAPLSKTELEVILRFLHNAHNKLRAMEKVLSIRAASFEEAIIEFDHFASELQAKSENNWDDFTELVTQMKQVMEMISASDVNDVNAMDKLTIKKESKKSNMEISESAASKTSENNQSVDKSNENDLESMILLHEIRIPVGRVNDIKVSPDGNIMAIAMNKGLFVFDTRSKIELWKTSSESLHVAFSPTSTQLAAAIETEEDIVIFDAANGARVLIFDGDGGKAIRVAWSSDNLIASSHKRNASILVRHPDGEVYAKYHQQSGVSDLSFSPEGIRLAVATAGLSIIELCNQEFYDKDKGYFRSGLEIISESRGVFRTAFSPDGSRVANISRCDAIFVLDSKTLEIANELCFNGTVDITWTPNSRFIAAISPGYNGNNHFFKILATDGNQFGEGVFQQNIFGDRVAFSLDGSEIITVNGSPGLVKVWMSPLFVTLMTEPMPSAANDETPFGQLHVIPPIDTHPVEHLFDRITTSIDRMDHPESFHRLVGLLHQFRNASATLKISESDADFLVIDSSSLSSSSSSSSLSSQQTRICKSTFESMLELVKVDGKKLLMLENKLLCQAGMFSNALIAYDSFVDELRMASEQHIDKLAGFVAYLSKPPMSADRLFQIKSVINSVLHSSVNQLSSSAMEPISNDEGVANAGDDSRYDGTSKRPRIAADQA